MKKLSLILSAFITGFIALTAIGGGIALLVGAEGGRFPLEWLQGSIFKDYTMPALLLAVVVGGTSLAACIAVIRKARLSRWLLWLAGGAMMGFIIGEILILKQVPPGPTPIEIFYFALGLLVFLFSFAFRPAVRR